MVIEKTRVKEVVENINPAKLNEYFQLKGIDVKLRKGNIMDVLDEIHDTEDFLELHKIYFFNQAPEEFEKILSFYEKATNSSYSNVVIALRSQENLIEYERALFLAIHNNKFFKYCFNAINIFATNTINYEIFTGVKIGVKIASENLSLLKDAIAEFSDKTFKSGADCVIEHFNLCDKDFFIVYTNKGVKTYTEIEDKKISRKKQKPVIEITFIYSSKEGKLEVGILNYKAKLLDFVALFGKYVLQDDISTSNLKKVYNLGLIKNKINKYGDFKFQNIEEMKLHISDLFYNTNDNFFGSIGGNKKNQTNFLNKVQKDKILLNAELVKVRIIATYKEEMESKTRTFTIQNNKCSLAYDKTDTSIRNILNNSGLRAISNLEIINAFKECLTKHKIINLYNISKMQENIQPFKWLIYKKFLTQLNDISYNLYCEECLKICNMEERGAMA